jgi:hypothetical protein
VHRLSYVLPGGGFNCRSGYRQVAGAATAGSVDGKPKMAAAGLNALADLSEKKDFQFLNGLNFWNCLNDVNGDHYATDIE